MADKMTARQLAGKRTARLLIPLLFAMILIVPPQSYYEVIEAIGYDEGYFAFWSRYLVADPNFCDADGCLDVPTWNHLWFVAYLLVYTLLLATLLALFRSKLTRLGGRLAAMPAWLLLVGPIAYLAAARFFLLPMFEVTHALVDDWYNHAVSFAAFLFGFLVLKDGRIAGQCIRLRHLALGLFLVAFAAYASYAWAYRADGAVPPEALRGAMRLVYAVDQWTAIVGALGYGALHLNRDSRLLRTLTEAVFPFYILHQTIIVVAGHHLKSLALPAPVEGAALVGLTAAGCWLGYAIARRYRLLRPLFGLGPVKPAPALRPTLDPMPAAD